MDIGFISVPPIETKKKHDKIFPFSSSINYGVLSLATHLKEYGFSSKVLDPGIWKERLTIELVLEWIRKNKPKYLALSCISGFSYPGFKILSREIRKVYPEIPIIGGGKDHLALIAYRALSECPEVDVIVQGEGEVPLVALLKSGFSNSHLNALEGIKHIAFRGQKGKPVLNKEKSPTIEKLKPLDFNLYENFRNHPPCIEVGRGCPFKCSFCSNDRNVILKKSPAEIIREAKSLSELYSSNDLFLYFQTPMFSMSDEELKTLAAFRNENELDFNWRAQTRVDYLSRDKLKLIYQAGGRVLDLGLESGSEEMLAAMNKTKSPVEYLSKASEILNAADQEQITLKINLLFYAGERRSTLLETFKFLEAHTDLSWTLSAYPLLIYPGTSLEKTIDPLLKAHGGTKVTSQDWNERVLVPVNPSSEFSYEEMQQLGILFGKSFQTSKMYFQERRYGHYRPNVSFQDFLEHLQMIDFELLPCSRDKQEMLFHRSTLKSILEKKYEDSVNWS